MDVMRAVRLLVLAAISLLLFAEAFAAAGPRSVRFTLRGAEQTFYVFRPDSPTEGLPAVIVASGDGGWHGLIIEVAQYLAGRGHTVVGMDSKAYLESLSKPKALEPAQVTGDFGSIAQFAKAQSGSKTIILVGWSEGAGLAVLGGLDPAVRADLRGVVAIGLPELNELAWRWSDAVIYVTHKVPNEPTFNSKDYVGRLAPVPLMTIQSTHDEFVPIETAREIFARAQEPKQLALIEAESHHFGGQLPAFWQALDRAFAWFETLAASSTH
jgi:dienelactone hydrolase